MLLIRITKDGFGYSNAIQGDSKGKFKGISAPVKEGFVLVVPENSTIQLFMKKSKEVISVPSFAIPVVGHCQRTSRGIRIIRTKPDDTVTNVAWLASKGAR